MHSMNSVVTVREFLKNLNERISPFSVNVYLLKSFFDDLDGINNPPDNNDDYDKLVFDDFDLSKDLDVPAFIRKEKENNTYSTANYEILDDLIGENEILMIFENLPNFIKKTYSEIATKLRLNHQDPKERSYDELKGKKLNIYRNKKDFYIDMFNYPPPSLEMSLVNLEKEFKELIKEMPNDVSAVMSVISQQSRRLRSPRITREQFEPYKSDPGKPIMENKNIKEDFEYHYSLIKTKEINHHRRGYKNTSLSFGDSFDNIFYYIDFQLKTLELLKGKLSEFLYDFKSLESYQATSVDSLKFKVDNILVDQLPLGNFPKLSSEIHVFDKTSNGILNIISRHFAYFNKDSFIFEKSELLEKHLTYMTGMDSRFFKPTGDSEALSIFKNKGERLISIKDKFDRITSADNQLRGIAPTRMLKEEPDLMEYYKLLKFSLPLIYPLHYSNKQKEFQYNGVHDGLSGIDSYEDQVFNKNKDSIGRETILMGRNSNLRARSLLELLNILFGALNIKLGVKSANFSNPKHKNKLEKYLNNLKLSNNHESLLSTNNEVFLNNYSSISQTLSNNQSRHIGYLNEIFTIYVAIDNWYNIFFKELLKNCNSNELFFLNRDDLSFFDKTSKNIHKTLFLDIEKNIDYVLAKHPFPNIDKYSFEDKEIFETGLSRNIKGMINSAKPIKSNLIPIFALFDWNKVTHKNQTKRNFRYLINRFVTFSDNKFGKILDFIHDKEVFVVEISNDNPTDSHKDKNYRAIPSEDFSDTSDMYNERGKSKPEHDIYDDKYGNLQIYTNKYLKVDAVKSYQLILKDSPLKLNEINVNVFKNECLYNFWNNRHSFIFLSNISKRINRQSDKILFNFSYKKENIEDELIANIDEDIRNMMHTAKSRVNATGTQTVDLSIILNDLKKDVNDSGIFFQDMENSLRHVLEALRSSSDELLYDHSFILEQTLKDLENKKLNSDHDNDSLITKLENIVSIQTSLINGLDNYFEQNMKHYKKITLKPENINSIKNAFDKSLNEKKSLSNFEYLVTFHDNLKDFTSKNMDIEIDASIDKLKECMDLLIDNSINHSFNIDDEELWDKGEVKKINVKMSLLYYKDSLESIEDIQSFVESGDNFQSSSPPNYLIIEYYNNGKEVGTSEDEYWEKDASYGKNKSEGIGTATVKKIIESHNKGNVFLDVNAKRSHRLFFIIPIPMKRTVSNVNLNKQQKDKNK